MSKNLSAKYYQKNKESFQKKLVKAIKIFLKKKKRQQYGREGMKNKSLLNTKKMIQNEKKRHFIIIIKLDFLNFFSLDLKVNQVALIYTTFVKVGFKTSNFFLSPNNRSRD